MKQKIHDLGIRSLARVLSTESEDVEVVVLWGAVGRHLDPRFWVVSI